MSLLDLPNELIGTIFRRVDRNFFTSNFNRVLVCKRWYTFAIREYYREIDISPVKLYRLLHSKSKAHSIKLLQDHAHEIRFSTEGFFTTEAKADEDEYQALVPLKRWVHYLHDYVRDLLPVLSGCTSLRDLSFRMWRGTYGLYERQNSEQHLITVPTEEGLISLTTITSIIQLGFSHNLMSLELDFRGSELVVTRDDLELLQCHLCPLIPGLLTQKPLHRLSVCLHNVCPDLLVLPVARSETTKPTIWVEEFVLNITSRVAKHSQLCYSDDDEEATLYVFEQIARNMLSQMARPRIVRVVSHDHPTLESIDISYYLRVYDAIADAATLAECVIWIPQPRSLRSFTRRLDDLF
ncbi:hypothetical protein BJX64DRAFT_238238 [Aspergillus heterothallicus]